MTGRPPDPEPDLDRWRNIGIVAHINAGKTTLTERILFDAGRQRFCGDVESGTATTDWLREEQERGISIDAAVTDVSWRGYRIQVVDTPGHVDFAAEVERTLRVLDGAVVVIDGVRGVEPQTESVWRALDRLRIPRVVFVNKLDRASADYDRAVASVRDLVDLEVIPVVVPLIGEDGGFDGLLDAVGGRTATWQPCEVDPARIEAARAAVVDRCADLDERLLAAFVADGTVDEAELHRVLREHTADLRVVPVFAGSALRNRGIEPLLDGICRYLRSPLERLAGMFPEAPPRERDATVAFVFKTGNRPVRGLALARIFRGAIRVGQVLETGAGDAVEVQGLWSVHADELSDLGRAGPGAIVGLRTDRPLRTGETLRCPSTSIVLEPIRFSEPVLSCRIEPRSADEVLELETTARELAADDPTLRVVRDAETDALMVSGMGELHLDVFRARLGRRIGHEVRFGAASVLRQETVAEQGVGRADCERAIGVVRIRAGAEVRVEPAPERGVVFRWAVAGDSPASVRDEILGELSSLAVGGVRASAPARDIAIEVREAWFDGPAEMAIPLLAEAAGLACRRAIEVACPVTLEPWVRVLVVTPSDGVSAVLADLRGRGARIEQVLAGLDTTELRGTVRLARVLGYATGLRSMTRGRGTFELALEGLEPVAEG